MPFASCLCVCVCRFSVFVCECSMCSMHTCLWECMCPCVYVWKPASVFCHFLSVPLRLSSSLTLELPPPPPPPVSPSHSAELQAHVTTLLGFELGSLRLRSKLFIHWTMSSAHVLTVWFLSSLLLSPFLGNSRQCILLTFTPFSQPLSDLTHPSLLTQVCVLFNVSLLVSFCHWLALQFICALQFACYLSARGKDTLLAFYFWRLDPKL